MSKVKINEFHSPQNGIGLSVEYIQRGVQKVWVNFDGTGVVSIRDSLNVSSISDVGTGQYYINYSNAFEASNYQASQAASTPGVANAICTIGAGSPETTRCFIGVANHLGSAAIDVTWISWAMTGDLV